MNHPVYNSLEKLQIYVLVYPGAYLLKLVMTHCKLFHYYQYDNDCSLSNVITDFYEEHPPVSISTALFLFVLRMVHQIYKSKEKQIMLDIIIIA